MAQLVERVLGKDEVTSSTLVSSSTASEIFGFQRFFLYRMALLTVAFDFLALPKSAGRHPLRSFRDKGGLPAARLSKPHTMQAANCFLHSRMYNRSHGKSIFGR